MSKTIIRDINAINQVQVLKGQLLEMSQTIIRDITAIKQVQVLKGQLLEMSQTIICDVPQTYFFLPSQQLWEPSGRLWYA
jgi:hypothetical protein